MCTCIYARLYLKCVLLSKMNRIHGIPLRESVSLSHAPGLPVVIGVENGEKVMRAPVDRPDDGKALDV